MSARSHHHPFFALLLALALVSPVGVITAADPPFTLQRGADELQVTTYADALYFPMGMALLPDGALLVGTSVPSGGGYFASTGQLLRLADENGDGLADGDPLILADGLPGAIVAVVRGGSFVFVTSAEATNERITILRRDGSWRAPLTVVGSIDFHFVQVDHQSYGLAVRSDPENQQRVELFFNVGAYANDRSGRDVNVRGLIEATLVDASLYRIVVEKTGEALRISTPELIATGLRNAAAFAFDPDSGDLLIADNGIDTPGDRIVAFSADEINRIPAGAIGGQAEDFGFPSSYVEYATAERVGNQGAWPEVAFVLADGNEREGAASLAIAPRAFPEGLNDGLVIGFHGQFDLTGVANEENPLAFVDLATDEVIDLIDNDEPAIGHLDTLLATDDALFVADLCGGTAGSLAADAPCGVIYRLGSPSS